jgi:hypothetical protein
MRCRVAPWRLLLLCAGLAVVGCDEATVWECIVPAGAAPDWTRKIGCQTDYEILWDERADSVFANTATINWLIDREDGDRVYFTDTKQWALHYFFADAYLNLPGLTPVGSHAEFNLLNYRRPNRRFVLGKVVHYHDQELITLELSAGDTADADMIVYAYQRIAASLFDGDRLLYRPVSATQETALPAIAARIPTIRTEDVFRGQTYQPLNTKTGFGVLRFVRVDELAGQPLLPTDIAVLDGVPNDIAMVSGIVTAEFQTPLAHINILAKNRGTPNMALRDAFSDPALRAWEGQLVRLAVEPQRYRIDAATAAEAQVYWDALRPAQPLVPAYDLSVTGLQDLRDLDADDAAGVGAKAANMAELMRIPGDPIPLPDAPLAIPLAYYHAHLTTHAIFADVEALLADAPTLTPAALVARLATLRARITDAPLDAGLSAEIDAAVRARWGDAEKIRFRSSTNAEDLADFSGAGLYTSASGQPGEGAESLAAALKTVWASTWNYEAFVERDFYRVDHRAVRMGVLVHPTFVGEQANGVAITINEFTPLRPAFYINSQVGDVSVTNPEGGATPEQILYYTWYEVPEVEVITRSSLVTGAVLADAELEILADHLTRVHDHFRQRTAGGPDFAMDVEFKMMPGRKLVLKQARPLKRR